MDFYYTSDYIHSYIKNIKSVIKPINIIYIVLGTTLSILLSLLFNNVLNINVKCDVVSISIITLVLVIFINMFIFDRKKYFNRIIDNFSYFIKFKKRIIDYVFIVILCIINLVLCIFNLEFLVISISLLYILYPSLLSVFSSALFNSVSKKIKKNKVVSYCLIDDYLFSVGIISLLLAIVWWFI